MRIHAFICTYKPRKHERGVHNQHSCRTCEQVTNYIHVPRNIHVTSVNESRTAHICHKQCILFLRSCNVYVKHMKSHELCTWVTKHVCCLSGPAGTTEVFVIDVYVPHMNESRTICMSHETCMKSFRFCRYERGVRNRRICLTYELDTNHVHESRTMYTVSQVL